MAGMTRHFTVDARAMLTWGRESIKDHTTAVLELVKNSYDANASVVEIQIHNGLYADLGPHIRIIDNGVGMSSDDIDKHWLRIGYSAKRQERFTKRGRRKTGEKGVGRISADRLGAVLELRTKAKNQRPSGIRIDWKEFETPGLDIVSVPVSEIDVVSFTTPQSFRKRGTRSIASIDHGTELLITQLRQEWTPNDVQDLRRHLALLMPPYDEVEEFAIFLDTDIEPSCNGPVSSPLMAAAAIEGHFELTPDGQVHTTLTHRVRSGTRRRAERTSRLPFDQLIHPDQRTQLRGGSAEMAMRLGPVSARFYFYPQNADTVRGLDLNLRDLRNFLRTYAGVRVYRDGIRVPPYGDPDKPEGDWLALGDRKARNPAGPNRPDYRVSPYQLVGVVMIGRDLNPALVDTSGREGLVTGEAYAALRAFLLGCLMQLEHLYHTIFSAGVDDDIEVQQSPRDTVDDLKLQLTALAQSIKKAEVQLPTNANKEIERVVEQLANTTDKLKLAERSFDELGTQAATSRTLATIGIASATFGHETQRGLDSLRATLAVSRRLLQNGEDPAAVEDELKKAIAESERVSAWGAFALGRVRRDKRVRKLHDIDVLVGGVLDEIRPAMEASSITLSGRLDSVKARVFAMDVETVLVNLLTNAYFFSKQSNRDRQVSVRLKQAKNGSRDGFAITVSDSGPGVNVNARQQIWDPLFTTKTDASGKQVGTGLGLALVSAVVLDVDGVKQVDDDPALRGARFTIWMPGTGG